MHVFSTARANHVDVRCLRQVYDTDAIRTAVNLCGSGGGGTVIFRAGYTFLTVRVARSELRVSGEFPPLRVNRPP